MTFYSEKIEDFKIFSSSIRDTITGFKGCSHLDILQDVRQSNIFFSYSHWDSEQHLNDYRNSPFFKKTWGQARQWFSEKPQAWSVKKISIRQTPSIINL